MVNHKLDTDGTVYFYEQEFYVLSNFSSFQIVWRGYRLATSEQAYHFERFLPDEELINEHALAILQVTSAHAAFQYAQKNKGHQRPDWDTIKAYKMREILWAKLTQHEYVARKLLETGERVLVEDSWRDGFWGWGEDGLGQNVLGQIWMEIRADYRGLVNRGLVTHGH